MALCGRREPELLTQKGLASVERGAGRASAWIETSACSPIDLGELNAAGRRFCYVLEIQITNHLFHRLVHGE